MSTSILDPITVMRLVDALSETEAVELAQYLAACQDPRSYCERASDWLRKWRDSRVGSTYVRVWNVEAGMEGIRCLLCGMISYHPGDVVLRYCGHCHKFHEERS